MHMMKGGTMESEVDSEVKGLALADVGECAASHWWLRNCRNYWKTWQKWAPKCNLAIWTNSPSILRQPKHLKPFEGWMLKLNIKTSKPFKGKDRFFIGTMTVSVKVQQKLWRQQSMISMLHDWAWARSADEWSANQNAHLSPVRVF